MNNFIEKLEKLPTPIVPPVPEVYQIEVSSICNSSCSYCPHRLMKRKQGNMEIETFIRTLEIMKNNYVALHHFGEPTLNPLLPYFIREANRMNIKTEFSTNGNNCRVLTKAIEEKPYLVRLALDSLENKHFIKFYEVIAKQNDVILLTHSVKKGTKPFINFAGAVEGKSQVKGECYFKKYNYVCILWQGDVVPCCCDYDGVEILGNVYEPDKIKLKENYSLCKTCYGLQWAEEGLWE